jgi:Zn finger protein HypA/HybF involved in hydrogenase expression
MSENAFNVYCDSCRAAIAYDEIIGQITTVQESYKGKTTWSQTEMIMTCPLCGSVSVSVRPKDKLICD